MQDVPEQLDGAIVVSIAPATPGRAGVNYATGEPVLIEYFAVAQYSSDGLRAYLFGVTADHQVACDYLHDSIEEAQTEAVQDGWVEPWTWRPRGER